MTDSAQPTLPAGTAAGGALEIKRDWRFYLGLVLFIYSFTPYLITPFVLPLLPLTDEEAVTVATGHILSGELAFLGSVALLGKPFIHYLMHCLRRLFMRKGPPPVHKPVSRLRHYCGVTLLLISCVVPYYVTEIALMTGYVEKHGHTGLLALLMSGDALFIASLFTLGANFWDRLMKLFRWPGNDPEPQPRAVAGPGT